jgi:hypothetical protein
MKYYTIQDDSILIADKKETLSKYYEIIQDLPEDYEEGKYIIGEKDIEIDVPDYDEEGNPIIIEYEDTEIVIDYDEEGNPIGQHEITVIKHKQQTHKETVKIKTLVLNPNWEEEQAEKREANFDKAFFNTSLGYIRRSVTMQDGSHKDFISDLLPAISMSVTAGKAVNILAYDRPPFDHDITDWTEYQHSVEVTAQFIQECFQQLSADFFPVAPKKGNK